MNTYIDKIHSHVSVGQVHQNGSHGLKIIIEAELKPIL